MQLRNYHTYNDSKGRTLYSESHQAIQQAYAAEGKRFTAVWTGNQFVSPKKLRPIPKHPKVYQLEQ